MAVRQAIKDHYLELKLFNERLLLAALGVIALSLLLLGRLAYLQLYDYDHYTTLSQNNRIRLVALPPARGRIYDRNGTILADNLPSYRLEVIPEQVKDLDATLTELAEVIDISELQLARFHKARQRQPDFQGIPLRFNLQAQEVARFAVDQHRFPGVEIQARLRRHYPHQSLGVHALGYVGRLNERDLQRLNARNYQGTTHTGKLGVERYYESILHGEVGFERVEVNAAGRRVRVLERQPPKPGQDIALTLDLKLQAVAERALAGRRGAVVALDPRTGEVLVLASMPAHDPNTFVQGISHKAYEQLRDDPAQPLFNRAVQGRYPPGSTIKPLVGLAGLEYGATWPGRTMYAGPYYKLPERSRKYRDWKPGGHGLVDLDKSIAQSCDVYFYDLAHRLGIDQMAAFLERFDLGRPTGLDVVGEAAGLLPTRAWKRGARGEPWYPGETLIAGIGQGYMLTTPLQLASVTATVAMEGERYRPHLLHGQRAADRAGFDGPRQTPLQAIELREAKFWDFVIEGMAHAVHAPNGTAFQTVGKHLPYRMAGKTGTSQVFGLDEGEEYNSSELARHLRDHALFIGFAPLHEPRIAIAVIVENGGSGSAVAAPVAREVIDFYLNGRLST